MISINQRAVKDHGSQKNKKLEIFQHFLHLIWVYGILTMGLRKPQNE